MCRFPHTECVRSLLKALQELQRLTERGLAVLLLHHPPKGEPRLGQAARGSGVLPAFADILLEMRVPQGDPATRRRRLHGFSRYPDTPQHLLIELTPAGNGYTVLAATNAGVFISRDGGEVFEAWNEGLDNPRVVSLAISPNGELVYALGLGGSVWRRAITRQATRAR